MLIGTYRDWDAYMRTENGRRECFMISMPKSTAPKNVNRGSIYVTVTHRPAAKVKNEVSAIVGYPFRKNSTASATVGGQRFDLFTQGDGAWLDNSKADSRMVSAMKKGSKLVLKGLSQRGTNTTDRYSLMGFTAAHNAISQACRVK